MWGLPSPLLAAGIRINSLQFNYQFTQEKSGIYGLAFCSYSDYFQSTDGIVRTVNSLSFSITVFFLCAPCAWHPSGL